MVKKTKQTKQVISHHPSRPPIVVVLGHVDHGKTTLLDYIRKTKVAAKEHGGITQAIGAYQAEISGKEGKRYITFIDTPGHEAFASMRSRGAQVADLAILVVAADDGVMPQTIEAIQHIKTANIPLIVAINKIDVEGSNVEKIKRQLAKADVLVEGYGGDVVVQPISAKTGQGVDQLLDMVILVSDLEGKAKEESKDFSGVVIESRKDKLKGPVASIVIRSGSLKVGMSIAAEDVGGRVRAMLDEWGQQVKECPAGKPIEVLGWTDVPPVGSTITEGIAHEKNAPVAQNAAIEGEKSLLHVVIKAESVGSLEALRYVLPAGITVISQGVGEISESDVLFAKTTGSIIIGFNVRTAAQATKIAELEQVVIKTATIIYSLVEELEEVIAALKSGGLEETLGEAKILAEFPFNRERIAGVKIASGRLAKGDTVKILRDKEEIVRGKIKSLRLGKNEVTKIEAGSECGVGFMSPLDFATGDAIIAYRK